MDKIDCIYCIVHPTYEADRSHKLIQQIQQRLPEYPIEKIQICAPTWGSTLTDDLCFQVYDPWLPRIGWPCFTWKNRCMIKGEISLILNFYSAMKDALNNKYKQVLILESDVCLRNDFAKRLTIILKKLEERKEPWDYVSLSDGVGTHATGYTGNYMEQTICDPPHEYVFRCTDSMLFHVSYLERILHTMQPFRECLDWELNIQNMHHQGISLWADPPLVEQGTCCGRLETTLTS
jgi:hypothetical protein